MQEPAAQVASPAVSPEPVHQDRPRTEQPRKDHQRAEQPRRERAEQPHRDRHAPRDEDRKPRRDDRRRDRQRDDEDDGAAVIGLGDHVPAFLLRPVKMPTST
jgi:hypothetical protein